MQGMLHMYGCTVWWFDCHGETGRFVRILGFVASFFLSPLSIPISLMRDNSFWFMQRALREAASFHLMACIASMAEHIFIGMLKTSYIYAFMHVLYFYLLFVIISLPFLLIYMFIYFLKAASFGKEISQGIYSPFLYMNYIFVIIRITHTAFIYRTLIPCIFSLSLSTFLPTLQQRLLSSVMFAQPDLPFATM